MPYGIFSFTCCISDPRKNSHQGSSGKLLIPQVFIKITLIMNCDVQIDFFQKLYNSNESGSIIRAEG